MGTVHGRKALKRLVFSSVVLSSLVAEQPATVLRGEEQPRWFAGERYEAVVPDTLELADRADLAINALTGVINTKQDYECFWQITYAPPNVQHHACQWHDYNPRVAEALTTLRLITGNQYKVDVEEKMLESMLSRIGEDGLYYNAPYREDAPWRTGGMGWRGKIREDDDITQVNGNGQLLIALIARYQRDKDPRLLETAKGLAKGLIDIAIYKEDYAYYPATRSIAFEFSRFKKAGWPDTEEAGNDYSSAEGAVVCYVAIPVRALCRWYELTGDEQALETAKKLVKYTLKPRFWDGFVGAWNAEAAGYRAGHGGAERKPAAFFQGHQAGLAISLGALSDYANVANDAYVKEFVRQGYEHFRNYGLARIGLWGENIANERFMVTAINLSDGGVGDYWEDVDQYVRNTIVEDQFVDADLIRKMCEDLGQPTETHDGQYTIDRFLGNIRHAANMDGQGTVDPTQAWTEVFRSEASGYFEPFYYVWESITRYTDGVGQINLLLNRASPWLDIDSYLPYEGKVVVRNKACHALSIRIPRWVDKTKVKCWGNESAASFFWTGNYLILTNLEGREVVTIEFPMVETTETYYLMTREVGPKWWEEKEKLPQYVLHLKGNTCIQIDFPNGEKFGMRSPKLYPVYQREHYREDKAPMKKVLRYVAPRLVDW